MTRALFPDLSACPDSALVQRWSAVLGKSPRLRPWLEGMLQQRRASLQQSGNAAVEEALWVELDRWLRDFEALPQFAVSAIAVTLEEPGRERKAEPKVPVAPSADSPERAATELQSLLADPAFALAFHCVDAKLRPALPLAPVPEQAWFGMLHASATPQALLTPAVAVGLVLRVSSVPWARLPSSQRQAALRLFHAGAADLRAEEAVRKLCAELPPAWQLSPAAAAEFVAGGVRARSALADACSLCARLAAAARPTRRGGLSVLQVTGSPKASAEDVAGLAQTARKYAQMAGFRRLQSLL